MVEDEERRLGGGGCGGVEIDVVGNGRSRGFKIEVAFKVDCPRYLLKGLGAVGSARVSGLWNQM